jgi:hypothetical protein
MKRVSLVCFVYFVCLVRPQPEQGIGRPEFGLCFHLFTQTLKHSDTKTLYSLSLVTGH